MSRGSRMKATKKHHNGIRGQSEEGGKDDARRGGKRKRVIEPWNAQKAVPGNH